MTEKQEVEIGRGIVCGCLAGFVFGVLFMVIATQIIVWTTPDDPTAGSVAIIVIITAPAGAIIGTILGPIIALKLPKLFRYILVPTSILTAVMTLFISLFFLIKS